MAKYDNQCLPLFDDGDQLTGVVTGGTVTGGTFVKPSGNFTSGPLLNAASPASDGGNMQVTTCTAAAKATGVAVYDGLVGDKIGIHSLRSGFIVPMTAGATLTAGQEVESNASGQPIVLASGRSLGLVIHGAASGSVAYIQLGA